MPDERYHIEKSSIGDNVIEVTQGAFTHKGVSYELLGGIDMSVFAMAETAYDGSEYCGSFSREGKLVLTRKEGALHPREYWEFSQAVHHRVRVGDSLVGQGPQGATILSGQVAKIEELPGLEARLRKAKTA